MNPGYVFRRIRGRIIPIKLSEGAKDVAVYLGANVAATIAANKLRKVTAKKTTGKESFGVLPNLSFEFGASTIGLMAASKKIPRIGRGFDILKQALLRR